MRVRRKECRVHPHPVRARSPIRITVATANSLLDFGAVNLLSLIAANRLPEPALAKNVRNFVNRDFMRTVDLQLLRELLAPYEPSMDFKWASLPEDDV